MIDPKTHKLNEGIPTNSVKIIDLYNKIDTGLLNTQPDYQRKLVWKKQHKYAFIETILWNFPFPEVYIASEEIDVEKMIAAEVVVDGQQRLTTIVEYIKGEGDFAKQNKVPAFNDLSPLDKKEFLNYKVSVKDLKDIGEEIIKEIFQRINNTEYSLNTVEKNNAIYGDGEIAVFCKQLVDKDYIPTEDDTDIIVDPIVKEQFTKFFNDNQIFTETNRKRMYDFQYIMLLTATILEGSYFARSSKVDEYLKQYHGSFPHYQKIIDLLLKSINTILQLKLSSKSYWYNQANMYTLLTELSKIDNTRINHDKLEMELLKLEEKVDAYFNADPETDLDGITEDEKRYFEVARHGSHEKPAREHRGKVVAAIIASSLNETDTLPSSIEKKNLEYLDSINAEYAVLIPTETGLSKSIIDAVSGVRDFLKTKGLHDYDVQDLGPDHKVKLKGFLIGPEIIQSEISLYRSNGRGDYRIWFSDLRSFAERDQHLAMIIQNGRINVLNISKMDYSTIL